MGLSSGYQLRLPLDWTGRATIVAISSKREAGGSRMTKLDLSLAIRGNSHEV
jgi:hypothetical protein